MKKIIAMLIMCLILLNGIPVYASISFDDAVDNTNSDIKDIKEREDYIVNIINDVLEMEQKEPIDSSIIDYNDMIKVYNGSDLFDDEALTKDVVQKNISNKSFDYVLPIYCDDITVMATLEIGSPMTEQDYEMFSEEDIEYFENEVGKWTTGLQEVYYERVNYQDEVNNVLSENNIENAQVYFIGSVSQAIELAAVICTDDSENVRFKILEQFETSVNYEENGYVPLDKNILYSFDEIKEFIAKEPQVGEDIGADLQEIDPMNVELGGMDTGYYTTNNNKILIISIVSGVAVAAIAVAVVCVIRKKKKAKNIES